MRDSASADQYKLNALMEYFPDTIYFKDREGRFTSVNQKQAEILGADSPEEVVGKTDFDFFPENQAQEAYEDEEWIMDTGKPIRDKEERITRADGTVICMSVTKMPLRDDEEQIIGTMGISRNITKRKAAEADSRRQRKLFRQLFKNSPVGIVILDKHHEIQEVNRSFEQIFGYKSDEIQGQNIDRLIVPEQQRPYAKKLTDQAYRGQLIEEETVRLHKDGSKVPVLIEDVPVQIDDEVIAVFAMYIDISKRKEYEKQIEQNLQEKRTLLEEIHHRVKNNLAILSGLLEMEQFNVEEQKSKDVLQASQSRIKSMALVHKKFYEFDSLAEIELGQYTQELTHSLCQTLLTDQDRVDVQVESDTVTLNIHQAVPIGILLNEILTNTFKYAFPEGQQGQVRVNIQRNDQQVTIEVEDNGVGLPEDLDIENTDSLGFELIHQLTDQLEGTLDVNSCSEGTTIRVQFELD